MQFPIIDQPSPLTQGINKGFDFYNKLLQAMAAPELMKTQQQMNKANLQQQQQQNIYYPQMMQRQIAQPYSQIGGTAADRDAIIQKYGEDSPQVKYFDTLSQQKGKEYQSVIGQQQADLEKLRKVYGEDSPEYKDAKRYMDARVGSLEAQAASRNTYAALGAIPQSVKLNMTSKLAEWNVPIQYWPEVMSKWTQYFPPPENNAQLPNAQMNAPRMPGAAQMRGAPQMQMPFPVQPGMGQYAPSNRPSAGGMSQNLPLSPDQESQLRKVVQSLGISAQPQGNLAAGPQAQMTPQQMPQGGMPPGGMPPGGMPQAGQMPQTAPTAVNQIPSSLANLTAKTDEELADTQRFGSMAAAEAEKKSFPTDVLKRQYATKRAEVAGEKVMDEINQGALEYKGIRGHALRKADELTAMVSGKPSERLQAAQRLDGKMEAWKGETAQLLATPAHKEARAELNTMFDTSSLSTNPQAAKKQIENIIDFIKSTKEVNFTNLHDLNEKNAKIGKAYKSEPSEQKLTDGQTRTTPEGQHEVYYKGKWYNEEALR